MRDPKRIPIILEKIRELWEQHPDLRLLQLLLNVFPGSNPTVYYTEDEKLIEYLSEVYERD